jgi:hypothetical protein
MTKIDRTPKKGLVLPNGNRLSHGLLFIGASKMQKPLDASSPLHPRNGSPKKVAVAPVRAGMRSRQTDTLHPYLHGQTVTDSTPLKAGHSGLSDPIHPGTKSSVLRGEDRGRCDGSAILAEAANLGRKC